MTETERARLKRLLNDLRVRVEVIEDALDIDRQEYCDHIGNTDRFCLQKDMRWGGPDSQSMLLARCRACGKMWMEETQDHIGSEDEQEDGCSHSRCLFYSPRQLSWVCPDCSRPLVRDEKGRSLYWCSCTRPTSTTTERHTGTAVCLGCGKAKMYYSLFKKVEGERL